MIPKIPEKTFFKIGEVATIVGVKPHAIRYWESEFRRIRTTKTKTGQRLFRRRDIFYLVAIRVLIHEHLFTVAGARARLEELIAVNPDGEAVLNAAMAGALISAAAPEASDETPEDALDDVPVVESPAAPPASSAPSSATSASSAQGAAPAKTPHAQPSLLFHESAARPRAPKSAPKPSETPSPQLSFASLDGVRANEYEEDANDLFSGSRADLVARIRVLEGELSSMYVTRAQLIAERDEAQRSTALVADEKKETSLKMVIARAAEARLARECSELRDELASKGVALDAAIEVLEDTRAEYSAQSIRLTQTEDALQGENRRLAEQVSLAHRELHTERTRASALFAELEETRARIAQKAAHRLVLEARLQEVDEILQGERAARAAAEEALREQREAASSIQECLEIRSTQFNVLRGQWLTVEQQRNALVQKLTSLEGDIGELQSKLEERNALYQSAKGQEMALTQRTYELEAELESTAQAHTLALDLQTSAHEEALAAQARNHEEALAAQAASHAEALATQARNHDEALAAQAASHAEAFATQARNHEEALAAQAASHADERAAHAQTNLRDLEDLARLHVQELETQAQAFATELQSLRDVHVQALEAREAIAQEERAALEAQHAVDRAVAQDLQACVEAREAQFSVVRGQLLTHQTRVLALEEALSTVEAQLAQTLATLQVTEQKLAERNALYQSAKGQEMGLTQRVYELEAELEEQSEVHLAALTLERAQRAALVEEVESLSAKLAERNALYQIAKGQEMGLTQRVYELEAELEELGEGHLRALAEERALRASIAEEAESLAAKLAERNALYQSAKGQEMGLTQRVYELEDELAERVAELTRALSDANTLVELEAEARALVTADLVTVRNALASAELTARNQREDFDKEIRDIQRHVLTEQKKVHYLEARLREILEAMRQRQLYGAREVRQ